MCPTLNPNQEDSYKERILQDTRIKEVLSYKERFSKPRRRCQPSATIKTPKPSQTKVHIIYLSSGTLELWKVLWLNLQKVFGWYCTGTLLGFSLSLFRRSCFEHVSIVRLTDDFRHHQFMSASLPSNGSLSIFLPSCLPLLTIYKCWQKLDNSVQVSLNPSFSWALFFCLIFFSSLFTFCYCLYCVVVWMIVMLILLSKWFFLGCWVFDYWVFLIGLPKKVAH